MREKIINLFLVLVVIGLFLWLSLSFYEAYKPKKNVLQGQIEAKEYSISSKIAGRIEDVFVQEGDVVKKGELIFSINSPELKAKINQAKAGKQAAKALSKQANKGARKQQIAAAKDNWQKAKIATSFAKDTYDRVKNLYEEGIVPKQKYDEAFTKYEASKYTQQAAFSMYEMAKEGTREEKKEAAKQKEKMAQGVLEEVSAYAQDLQIKSFYDGEVSMVLLHKGELAPQGFPVVQVVDVSNAWASFHIRENELSKFKKGTEFKVKIPALGDERYTFKVHYISVLGDYATWRATNIQKDFDLRTFEVRAKPIKDIKDLRVGMSVLVD